MTFGETRTMSRDQALTKIEKYFQSGDFESDLNHRIAFKTESNLPNCDAALNSYLENNSNLLSNNKKRGTNSHLSYFYSKIITLIFLKKKKNQS